MLGAISVAMFSGRSHSLNLCWAPFGKQCGVEYLLFSSTPHYYRIGAQYEFGRQLLHSTTAQCASQNFSDKAVVSIHDDHFLGSSVFGMNHLFQFMLGAIWKVMWFRMTIRNDPHI